MRNPPIYLVLAAISFASLARGEEPEWRRGFMSQADGKQYGSYVTDQALAKTPIWANESEHPPFSARRASSIALKQLEKTVANVKQWKLDEIAIVDSGDHLHWIYVVRFRRIYPESKPVIGADYFNLAVLMDGTPIRPTEVQP